MTNFDREYRNYLQLVEEGMKKYILDYPDLQKKLFDSVNYSLLASGKRLRPVMLVSACEMAGGRIEDALPFAIGLEMIHCSSLIHDDLPAMDDDDLRRGKPTNHKVFGEATAILAGDTLLVRPFEIMASNTKTPYQIKAIEIIAKAAGAEGMMGGQQIDLDNENKNPDEDTIIKLNMLKTGALFKAAIVAGVTVAGAADERIEAAKIYGDNFGVAFQLVDDLIDNDPNVDTGKTKGSDIERNKSTYLAVYGKEKCLKMIDDCVKRSSDALGKFGEKGTFLKEMLEFITAKVK